MLTPDRSVKVHFISRLDRRMAATALAIRMYELDLGRRPATLDALVPDYLDAVPSDPFRADNAPLGYLPDAAHPRLYSVGEDGIDDGGEYVRRLSGNIDLWKKDSVYFLDGGAARQPPEGWQE